MLPPSITLAPIGFVHTCFKEKFGVPRQSLMISEARGVLKLNPDVRYRDALATLEEFSHVWIIFIFHEHTGQEWRPKITPPRTELNERVGVLASRSPHRPNPIGLSAVKLEKIDYDAPGGIEIHLSGVDLLDGTPVLDIKPYVRYVDSIPDAKEAWTHTAIQKFSVKFSPESLKRAGEHEPLLRQMLELDPRPTSQRKSYPIDNPKNEGRAFAFRIFDFDVKWEIKQGGVFVREII